MESASSELIRKEGATHARWRSSISSFCCSALSPTASSPSSTKTPAGGMMAILLPPLKPWSVLKVVIASRRSETDEGGGVCWKTSQAKKLPPPRVTSSAAWSSCGKSVSESHLNGRDRTHRCVRSTKADDQHVLEQVAPRIVLRPYGRLEVLERRRLILRVRLARPSAVPVVLEVAVSPPARRVSSYVFVHREQLPLVPQHLLVVRRKLLLRRSFGRRAGMYGQRLGGKVGCGSDGEKLVVPFVRDDVSEVHGGAEEGSVRGTALRDEVGVVRAGVAVGDLDACLRSV